MPAELSRDQERQGTRRLMLGGAVIAAILLVAFVLWPLLVTNKLGTPPGGANSSTTSDTTKSRGTPAQQSAESTVGKSNPAGPEDATGGRARQIKQSSHSLQLSDAQREQVKRILSQQNPPKIDKADFELMIGAAVPAQAPLQDIPPEITQVMNGYWGDQYLMVRDTLVIVDQHSRRVVAIVTGAA